MFYPDDEFYGFGQSALKREEVAEERLLRCHPDPERCVCGGSGVWYSNYDSAERCSFHNPAKKEV
jgi:hypothetical protein